MRGTYASDHEAATTLHTSTGSMNHTELNAQGFVQTASRLADLAENVPLSAFWTCMMDKASSAADPCLSPGTRVPKDFVVVSFFFLATLRCPWPGPRCLFGFSATD
ncbi:hypothetical protein LIA77_09520 [Sarocladium implicatum]|nr:hypothetical protein LIA77_09520 [Sarocladium implicatum]